MLQTVTTTPQNATKGKIMTTTSKKNLTIWLGEDTKISPSSYDTWKVETDTDTGFITRKAAVMIAETLGYEKHDYMSEAIMDALGITYRVTERDEYGDSQLETWTLPASTTDAQLERFVNVEGNWCQHEYDCCGGWYSSPASIVRTPEAVTVTQSSSRNV